MQRSSVVALTTRQGAQSNASCDAARFMGLVDYFHLRSVGGSGKALVASYGECRVHELISRGERHQLSFAPSAHGERTRRVMMLSTYG